MGKQSECINLVRRLTAMSEAGALKWESTADNEMFVTAYRGETGAVFVEVRRDVLEDTDRGPFGPPWVYSLKVSASTAVDGEELTTTVEEGDVGGEAPLRRLFELASSDTKRRVVNRALDVLGRGEPQDDAPGDDPFGDQ